MAKNNFKNYKRKEKEEADLGFGTRNYGEYSRFLNQDGSVNIRRRGVKFLESIDLFHSLITMRLGKFIFLVLSFYFVVNLGFAFLYYLCGPENFGNFQKGSSFDQFTRLFFFSSQTLTTVGYGYTYPKSNAASAIAAVESLFGLLGFALATGILYGRFSRPRAEIIYSKKMLLAPYRGITALMFRMANGKQNELIELEAQVILSMNDVKTNTRIFQSLQLERKSLNFLALTWTVVHPIDESSILAGRSHQELLEGDAEIIILIKAINDTYSQTVYSRASYKADEIGWGYKFKPMKTVPGKKGKLNLNLEEINDTEKAELPVELEVFS